MQFVGETVSARYEVKKSIFISYLTPFENFKSLHEALKIEHPKATHIIYAYRTLNEFDHIVENASDDNEPKGCAGAPTLSVLRGEEIINSALLTVRYFGGVKLGTGGMIRGYGSSAKEVMKVATLLPYQKRYPVSFETPYALVARYEHYFTTEQIDFSQRDFGASGATWHLSMTASQIEKFEVFKHFLS